MKGKGWKCVSLLFSPREADGKGNENGCRENFPLFPNEQKKEAFFFVLTQGVFVYRIEFQCLGTTLHSVLFI